MSCNRLGLEKALHQMIRDPYVQLPMRIPVRNTVIAALGLHVIIHVHFQLLPFSEGIRRLWKWTHRRQVQRLKLTATRAQREGRVVQLIQEWTDGLIEFRNIEELTGLKLRQDPGAYKFDRALYSTFILRLFYAGRRDNEVVVASKIFVGFIEYGCPATIKTFSSDN